MQSHTIPDNFRPDLMNEPFPENPFSENPFREAPYSDDPYFDDLDDQNSRDELEDNPLQDTMPKLVECDLADFFGDNGPIMDHLPNYEMRPSQVQMAEAVKRALLEGSHALIEAPTGTGKSIAYLIPALLSGKTIIVATANKSLQSQLYHKDIPFLSEVMAQEIKAVLVKGRSNFVCTHKWEQEDQAQQQIALYDPEDPQITQLRQWLAETNTGDIDDLDFVLDGSLRNRVVSFTDDCLHQDCRHHDDSCWVNHMRDAAAEAQVLITNHHLLLNALELGWAGERILPPAAIYIIDEAHQLEQTATSVFEVNITDYTLKQLLSRSVLKEHVSEEKLDTLAFHNTVAFQEVERLSRDNSFRIETDLERLKDLGQELEDLSKDLKRKNPYRPPEEDSSNTQRKESDEEAEKRRNYDLTMESLNSLGAKFRAVATTKRDTDFVRYASRIYERRHVTMEIHSAPINPANLLSRYLFHAEDDNGPVQRSVICTSATLSTHKNFQHFKERCGLEDVKEEFVLPAVFDYPQQALLYQPPLPAYNWQNAQAYYQAAAAEIARLLEASRGRTLCLFTSWSGLKQVSELLQQDDKMNIWPLRAQGDAPRDALLTWFRETPYSVLLATRSFWEGVDIPGDDLSLVILDKMPFPTPKDPLHSSRMKAIDEGGGHSFGDYMAPLMTLALKQGFGRLIRRRSDLGVVAILDERLTSKPYGRQAQQDLPPARLTRSFKDVHQFFQKALDRPVDFALNLQAIEQKDAIDWRWQLLRLLDGKADSDSGSFTPSDTSEISALAEGEIHAGIAALQNLRTRIENAQRKTADFGVEVRCSPETVAQLQSARTAEGAQASLLLQTWQQEQAHWLLVELLEIGPRIN